MKLEKNGCERNQLFLDFPPRWRHNTELSQYRARDIIKGIVFCLFQIYACECTCRRWNFKVSIPKGVITWSALGEQNAAAKVSYLSLSKGGQFGAVVAWSLFPNREWIPGIFILQKCQFMGIAVITVEPADKISFVYSCMETRLRGQTMGNDPLASFVCQERW